DPARRRVARPVPVGFADLVQRARGAELAAVADARLAKQLGITASALQSARAEMLATAPAAATLAGRIGAVSNAAAALHPQLASAIQPLERMAGITGTLTVGSAALGA